MRNHPKENKKAFTEQGIMFFRNTHVAHKILRKPYFTGCVVLQTIIYCFEKETISTNISNPGNIIFPGFFFWLKYIIDFFERNAYNINDRKLLGVLTP